MKDAAQKAAGAVTEIVGRGIDLSDPAYNFQAEYFYSEYNAASRADTARQDGVDTFADKDIVLKNLHYDQLIYLLQQKGNYLILFGGSWCVNSRSAIGYVNACAKAHGIDTVYTFDFRLDGRTRDTHIRESALTPEYGGEAYTAADWNYLYGEIIDRYLTNLNDWVEYRQDGADALTWYDKDYNARKAPKVQAPFLFLYNKDNTTRYLPVRDQNGKQTGVEPDKSASGRFPIVCGFEEMVCKDSNGVYDGTGKDGSRNYITDAYTARLNQVFRFIRENGVAVSRYTDADYLYDAFIVGNGRGHAEKLYDIFRKGEQINLEVITYRQMEWLLEQEGSAVVLFGGAWCANATAAVGPINDYAVANNITVYMMDFRLDGKHPIDFWGYDRDRQFTIRASVQEGKPEKLPDSTFVGKPNPFAVLYTSLVNRFLTNLETISDPSEDRYYITAVDADGRQAQALRMQMPYLFAYNKDAAAPILAWHEEMYEVTAPSLDKGSYIYIADNYASYTAGMERVLRAYAGSVGRSYVPYTGQPRQELLEAATV